MITVKYTLQLLSQLANNVHSKLNQTHLIQLKEVYKCLKNLGLRYFSALC